jgi:hypothetical protein
VAEPSTPTPATPTDVLIACKAAGCLDLAEDLIRAGATSDQVAERVMQAQEERAAKAKVEAEAERQRRADADAERERPGQKRRGRAPTPVEETPPDKAQMSFTDAE